MTDRDSNPDPAQREANEKMDAQFWPLWDRYASDHPEVPKAVAGLIGGLPLGVGVGALSMVLCNLIAEATKDMSEDDLCNHIRCTARYIHERAHDYWQAEHTPAGKN